jgi:hypothetical protein
VKNKKVLRNAEKKKFGSRKKNIGNCNKKRRMREKNVWCVAQNVINMYEIEKC